MGRPRAFDEVEVTEAAARLFAARAYDGVSVDDLVGELGVHRNSLYKVFGSKRGLYLAALRRHLDTAVRPLLDRPGDLRSAPALDLLLLAAVERAPVDAEVAGLITGVLKDIDAALGHDATGTILADRLRARAEPK